MGKNIKLVFGKQKCKGYRTDWFQKKSFYEGKGVTFSEILNESLDSQNILIALYIDFKYAQEKVWIKEMFKEFRDSGVSGNMLVDLILY